jgi:hypothetical protein
MLAEISLLISGLKAINEGVRVVKESGSHLEGLAGVFDKLTESKKTIETIEHEAKEGSHVLSQQEALELALAREALKKEERELKRSVPAAVWRDMLHIQHKSLMEHKHLLERERLARNRALTKRTTLLKNTFGILFLFVIGLALFIFIE